MITLFIALGIWILLGIIGMVLAGIYDYYDLGYIEYTIKDLALCVVAGPIGLLFIIGEILKEKGDVVIFRKERPNQKD